jgi:hypothetical protein
VTTIESLRDQILSLLPPGTTPSGQLDHLDGMTLHFDPTCAGNIERTWPRIYKLCMECGCTAVLIASDTMKVVSVLDTESGAPNYSTENEVEVKLVLTREMELEEAA